MRSLIIFISLVLFTFSVSTQNANVKQVNPDEFQKLITDPKGVLLDVRTRSEYKNGHISNSGQLNYYTFDFKKKLLLLPKDEPIYLYCNTGYRSERCCRPGCCRPGRRRRWRTTSPTPLASPRCTRVETAFRRSGS